jgi:hypothetical protein
MRVASAILAAVLAVSTATACSSAGGRGGSGRSVVRSDSLPANATVLVCREQPGFGGDVVDDEAALAGRVRTFRGGVSAAITHGDELTVTMTGVPRAQARTLCNRGVSEIRGLVTATQRSSCVRPSCGHTPTDEFPTTEPTFDALPSLRKAAIARALRNAACATPHARPLTPVEIVCDAHRRAYLLGPTLARGVDVVAATRLRPSPGSTRWSVLVTLDAAAQDALSRYTNQNNVGGTPPTGGPQACGSVAIGTPCADYIAFVVDGVVISAPVTLAPITGGTVQISGDFTRDTATLLAAVLAQGPLPVPLEFGSLH